MKLALTGLLFSTLAFAAPNPELIKSTLEQSSACENFVRYDDANVYLGFGQYRRGFEDPRQPHPGFLRVLPLGKADQAFSLLTADAAVDSVSEGGSLFVLTYTGLEEWDLASHERKAIYPTYATPNLGDKEHAESMARYGNKLIIAHGRLGVSIFSLESRRVTNQIRLVQDHRPLESMATGVAVAGKYAYVTLDNYSLAKPGQQPAFRGIVVLDLETETVVRELDGMDPFASGACSDGNKLLVAMGGGDIVWKYSLASLTARTLPEPENRVWKFPANGHPVGHASLDEKYYYSCYSVPPAKPGQPYRLVPRALDRKSVQLD